MKYFNRNVASKFFWENATASQDIMGEAHSHPRMGPKFSCQNGIQLLCQNVMMYFALIMPKCHAKMAYSRSASLAVSYDASCRPYRALSSSPEADCAPSHLAQSRLTPALFELSFSTLCPHAHRQMARSSFKPKL